MGLEASSGLGYFAKDFTDFHEFLIQFTHGKQQCNTLYMLVMRQHINSLRTAALMLL